MEDTATISADPALVTAMKSLHATPHMVRLPNSRQPHDAEHQGKHVAVSKALSLANAKASRQLKLSCTAGKLLKTSKACHCDNISSMDIW